MLRNAWGVVSDLIIEKDDWDVESVKNASRNGRHAGFGEWETFIVGNHSYSSAMFRTTIETSSVELGLLTDFYILVDVQVVLDRGAISLKSTGAESFVRFNKVFLTEPEVVATIRAGTSASTMVPVVGQVTREGFYVTLKNMSDDTEVSGTISWIAHGY